MKTMAGQHSAGGPDATHAFKNHLAIIIGFSELLLAELPEDSGHRKDVQEINKAAHEALALLAEVLPETCPNSDKAGL